jgi:hypothetical protein
MICPVEAKRLRFLQREGDEVGSQLGDQGIVGNGYQ